MELSNIVQRYAPVLNRSESDLVSALSDDPSPIAAERYERQIKALADARAIMKQMPDKKSADRQNRAEKIRMLKERLRMLKQMVPFMSPAAAKSLKAELQQIASQLSSLAVDGSGGTSDPVTGVSGGSGTMTATLQTGISQAAGAEGGTAVEDAPAGEQTPLTTSVGKRKSVRVAQTAANRSGPSAGTTRCREKWKS